MGRFHAGDLKLSTNQSAWVVKISFVCNVFYNGIFISLQAIFTAQKTSVPGDFILVPGATEKISFIHICVSTFLLKSHFEGSFYIKQLLAILFSLVASQIRVAVTFHSQQLD